MRNAEIVFPLLVNRRARTLRLCVVLWGRRRPDPGFERRLSIGLALPPFTSFRDLGDDAWEFTFACVRLRFTQAPCGVLRWDGPLA